MTEPNINDRKNIPKKEVKEVKEPEIKKPEELKEPSLKVLGSLSTEQIQETAKKYGISKDEAKELLNEASETFIKRLLSELQEKEPEVKEPEVESKVKHESPEKAIEKYNNLKTLFTHHE